MTNTSGLKERHAGTAIGVLFMLKVAILFLFAWNQRFVMDEFAQLGWAKYLPDAFFHTIWPPKAVGFQIFIKLAHLISWDATSILLAGRIQTALLACATLALVYGCARTLGNDRLRSLAILVILLCFSNFIERVFRTIAEPLALFFAVAALLVVLRGRADKAGTVIVAGILSCLSFLTTQKGVYFNVALGVALVADAALARRYADGIRRGAWLAMGWTLPVIVYCLVFGGTDPVPVARNLFLGPVEVATTGADAYGGLRHYVVQTLSRNPFLYIICFAGMALSMMHIGKLDERRRVTLIFSVVISTLVFTHDQPWPYVFIMALPFMALWSLELFDRLAGDERYLRIAWLALGIAIAASFIRNVSYLKFDNRAQLELVARAEALVGREEQYFDGVGMLPNRIEPSTLWLDRQAVLRTLQEGTNSSVYKMFEESPPKVVIWSYRLDAIERLVAPQVKARYVRVSPNLWLAGRRLIRNRPVRFIAPTTGTYRLYSEEGKLVEGRLDVDGVAHVPPLHLDRGPKTIILRAGPKDTLLLLPTGSYYGRFGAGPDNKSLFARVYD